MKKAHDNAIRDKCFMQMTMKKREFSQYQCIDCILTNDDLSIQSATNLKYRRTAAWKKDF